MQRLFTLFLLLCSALFAACQPDTPDNTAEVYRGERLSVNMRFLRSEVTADEEQMATVRVVVFNHQGALVFNDLAPILSGQGPEVTVRADMAIGYNNVYVVCNETRQMGTQLMGITNQRELEQITLEAQGVSTPIPMYGKVLDVLVMAKADGSEATVTVHGNTSSFLSVAVDRLLAKLSMTVIKNSAGAPEDFTVEKLSYRILRLPRYVGLGPNTPYVQNLWADNIEQTSYTRLVDNGTFEQVGDDYRVQTGDYIQFPSVYLPEHILARRDDPTQCTYMEITAWCRTTAGGLEAASTYRLDLGQAPPSNLNIARNDHHRIYATVTRINEGFSAQMRLAPWNDGGTIEVKEHEGDRYLNVSQVAVSEAVDAVDDLNKTYSHRIFFWSNQPYDQIKLLSPTITYTDPSGAVFVGSDAYFEAKYTPGVDVRDEYVPQLEVTITKEPQKDPDNSNAGWVDVTLRMPTRRIDWKKIEVSFQIQARNLNRKVTLSYPTTTR